MGGGLLNAKGFGIPQNRDRIFVLSILGEYSYTFPQPFELTKKLKDLLEDEVDEKYFLTQKQIDSVFKWKAFEKPFETMAKIKESEIVPTITTRSGAYAAGMILIPEATQKGYALDEVGDGVYLNRPHQKRGVVQKETIPTLTTSDGELVRVRKLTPLETWRLMGISDEDFNKAKASGVSNAQLYKQAGNAIVVDVLYHIFKNLFE